MDWEARSEGWLQGILPVMKLLVTIVFLVAVLSVGKYDVAKLLLLSAYIVVSFILGGVSVKQMWRRMWTLLLLVCFMGVPNPYFDRQPLMYLGSFSLTGGMLSMLTLLMKGCLAIAAAYMLMVTTTMEELCHALRTLHVPSILVTLLLLVYRYLMVFLQEVKRITQAYSLRAPGQRGVHFRVWGSMVGNLFLHSIDRAEVVYESMLLRGFQGEFFLERKQGITMADLVYLIGWISFFIVIRWL